MKKTVYRMCVQTRDVVNRREMIRIVMSNDILQIDDSYKIQGRSIYIKRDRELITKFISRKNLPVKMSALYQQQLRELLANYEQV